MKAVSKVERLGGFQSVSDGWSATFDEMLLENEATMLSLFWSVFSRTSSNEGAKHLELYFGFTHEPPRQGVDFL